MITEFCKIVMIREADILGASLRREICDARHLYWKLLSEKGFGYSKIARLNGRNHSTIIHGVKMADSLIATDAHIRGVWERVRRIEN